jgi:hypothetical protein
MRMREEREHARQETEHRLYAAEQAGCSGEQRVCTALFADVSRIPTAVALP